VDIWSLQTLHHLHNRELVTDPRSDQKSHWHEKFYAAVREHAELKTLFRDYARWVVSEYLPYLDEPLYQAVPTFRAQHPNNLAVAEWHRDADYRHSEDEVTVFIPITDALNTAAIQIARSDGSTFPLNAYYGDIVIWDSARVTHGNAINCENYTRVSLDMRFIEKRLLKPDQTSITANIPMRIGGYWEELWKYS